MKRLRFALGAGVAATALLVGCAGDDAEGGFDDPLNTDPTTEATVPAGPTGTSPDTTPATTGTATATATSTAAAGGETVESSISDGDLEDLDITPGTTVVWTNEDDEPRSISSISTADINSGPIAPGETYEYTFTETGVFDLVVDDGTDIYVVTVEEEDDN